LSLTLYFFYGVLIIAVFRLAMQLILAAGYNLKGKAKSTNSFPSISIIVPAFNEGITLMDCLKSLTELDYPDYEIIVIDDGSTDRTLEEAEEIRGFRSKSYSPKKSRETKRVKQRNKTLERRDRAHGGR
jgi:cellulose synthase/poly-beta-1,6-N-acetylglucosamine synthase-like glycosyltransferase